MSQTDWADEICCSSLPGELKRKAVGQAVPSCARDAKGGEGKQAGKEDSKVAEVFARAAGSLRSFLLSLRSLIEREQKNHELSERRF